MGQYSIKDIETLSGIKAHTLRIWEQRYGFMIPHRTDTNIRYYSDDQLKMILNVSILNKHGIKISKIAEMNHDQVKENVLKLAEESEKHDDLLDALIRAMIDFDEGRFEKALNSAIVKLGFQGTFEELLLPFLQRTGVLWTTGAVKPAQEHFMSNLIRRKLSVAIDSQYITPNVHTKRFVLFLPEGEWHELLLLYTDYLLRTHHHEVVYLGASVPLADLDNIGDTFHADYLLTYLTGSVQEVDVQNLLYILSKAHPHLNILVGGAQLLNRKLRLPDNVFNISDKESLLSIIKV